MMAMVVGGLVALALPLVVRPSRLRAGASVAMAVLLALSVGGLIVYATEVIRFRDVYASRWDFAGELTPLVLFAISTALPTAMALILSVAFRNRGLLPDLALFAASLACVLLLLSWFVLDPSIFDQLGAPAPGSPNLARVQSLA